jgi:hypothetical protein
LIAGVARALVNQSAIGVSAAHADTIAFVERLMQNADRAPLPMKRVDAAGDSRLISRSTCR